MVNGEYDCSSSIYLLAHLLPLDTNGFLEQSDDSDDIDDREHWLSNLRDSLGYKCDVWREVSSQGNDTQDDVDDDDAGGGGDDDGEDDDDDDAAPA